MTPCVSQACTLPTEFAADLAAAAGAGVRHVEVWLTKLETYLEKHPAEELDAVLRDTGVSLAAAAFQGGVLLSAGDARAAHLDHFKKRLAVLERFRVPTLVVVPDLAGRPDATTLPRLVANLAEAARWAAGFGVTLALEFRGTDAACASLDTAVAIVEACGEPNVGVCLDAFHYHKGPSKPHDLDRLTKQNLAHVQVCDVPGVPRELMTDADRVFPGEGDFRLADLRAALARVGYAGPVSVEAANPMLWKAKPSQVAELALAAVSRWVAG